MMITVHQAMVAYVSALANKKDLSDLSARINDQKWNIEISERDDKIHLIFETYELPVNCEELGYDRSKPYSYYDCYEFIFVAVK